jgi:hypothetical protein
MMNGRPASPGAAAASLPATTPAQAYSLRFRLVLVGVALLVGTLVAGFWNAGLVDGFGRTVVAGDTIGNPDRLAGTFGAHGFGFGFLFAAIAGMAATFTACNCVVFAMIPGLACTTDRTPARTRALRALAAFSAGVLLVGAVYGAFIGLPGPDGIAALNGRAVSLAQARTVFTTIGGVLILRAALSLGLLNPFVVRLSPDTRAFFGQAAVKSLALGVLAGSFAVGRPFPVFRDLLTYAAAAHSPLYGAGVLMLQGLGQIAVMALLFVAVVYGLGDRLANWVQRKPYQGTVISAMALAAGGMYLVFYWGIALGFNLGGWGVKLGWYR